MDRIFDKNISGGSEDKWLEFVPKVLKVAGPESRAEVVDLLEEINKNSSAGKPFFFFLSIEMSSIITL